jgi:GTPase SAR1 family protein
MVKTMLLLMYHRLQAMLEGLPELHELNMYGNKVAEIVVPRNLKILSKLEILNLGYNDLSFLPDDLDQLKSLRTLLVMNNFLEKVPMRICEMDIRIIDVSSNPVIQPPTETCERGICSMRRYYHCLRAEEQVKHKALEELQKKSMKGKKREVKNPFRIFGSKLSSNGNSKSFGDEETHHSLRISDPAIPNQVNGRGLPRLRSRSYDEAQFEKVVQNQFASKSKSDIHSESEFTISSESKINSVNGDVSIGNPDDAVVNDTLKVIFVGMAMTGKTSMIRRLIEGKNAIIPKRDERTIGVDIYEWDPCTNEDRNHVDTRIQIEDVKFARDVKVKFSVWDFAGQHVYHATHELFFSPHALYVIVWDMGATNQDTHRRKLTNQDHGTFSLSYDSSDDEEDDQFHIEEESRRADRALERDIDEKVQFWVECIQSCAPGAAILPVASFNDFFEKDNEGEAVRRCSILKARLLKHEERRIAGLKQRLDQYTAENKADDDAANRLRKLLCPYTRPKLLFVPEGNVVRVSGTEYTGFERLTEHIVNIATGKDKVGLKYPVFRGHVGARIPRMRLEVRDTVREIRDKFKVVEFGYFVSKLSERGLSNVEDISDALHFLTNTGELSYFGNVITDHRKHEKVCPKEEEIKIEFDSPQPNIGDDDLEDYEQNAFLSMDETTLTVPTSSGDGSVTSFDDFDAGGLSHYIFLNPRWLVASVACILRHDLDMEIRETRRRFSLETRVAYSAYEGNLNCPVITSEDALMLWQAKKFTRKAADRAEEYSNNMKITPFVFLQQLLIRFGVFVPIDLSIDKALLGGKQYAIVTSAEENDSPTVIDMKHESESQSSFFFLPSLLGPGEPAEAWTFKNTDSWKITLCHSILFPDGVPPGLMERISAAVLSTIYAVSKGCELLIRSPFHEKGIRTLDGNLRVREILCWRTAFFLKLGTEIKSENQELKESIVEIFAHLVDRDSHHCVGSGAMGSGMRRLVISAKGQVGDGGRRIWNGGYLLVLKSVSKIMQDYGGLEFERQGFCPECLSKMAISDASSWDWTVMREAAQNCETTMHCHHGHRIDTRLITGPVDSLTKRNVENTRKPDDDDNAVQVSDLIRAVVLVGLWDPRARKVVRAGSGFIVDKKRGLIVTASHTLMNIWGEKSAPFGENYYGLRDGKVVIGIIPRNKDSGTAASGAVFRYFARILKKDPIIESRNECQMDACILRITTKLENDVSGNVEGCGNQPEILLEHNHDAIKRERLQQLKVTDKCELDEQVRIIGFNQGGEGLLDSGEILNRYVDFAKGYVCKKFANNHDGIGYLRHQFKPREEIVVICPTIGGHSGGPCVNQQGEVIGILSRADPTEKQRCYLVPSYEWIDLIKQAKLCR